MREETSHFVCVTRPRSRTLYPCLSLTLPRKAVLASVIVQGERQNSLLGPPVTPAAVSLVETVADRRSFVVCQWLLKRSEVLTLPAVSPNVTSHCEVPARSTLA